MFVKRALEKAFKEADAFFPVLLLTGARQVGKTTFLRNLAGEKRRYVSLDTIDVQARAKSDPRLFLADNPPPVIIDEIQNVPELLPYIKAAVDEARHAAPGKAHGRYWLTGSQQFRLMKGVAESLAGRVGIFRMPGLSAAELAGRANIPFLPDRSFPAKVPELAPADFYRALWLGSFPGLATRSDGAKFWSRFYASYLESYLERDVRDLTQVADERRFYAFLQSVAARSGQMLNFSDLARDVGMSQPTAKSWLSILETSDIVRLLYPYRANRTAQTVATPKIYMMDTGLMAFLTAWNTPEALAAGAQAGHFFETWCMAEILKSHLNAGLDPEFYYFRNKNREPVEIDLVIKSGGKLYPVEFKKSATVGPDAARNFEQLQAFKSPVGTGAVVSLTSGVFSLTPEVRAVPATLV